MRSKGFTLVELLVVLAVLGVLAAGLMMAINPVEQRNKAIDGAAVSRGRDVISAAQRYWTIRNAEPANCAALEGATGELRVGTCAPAGQPALTLAGSAGSYTVEFTPVSSTYGAKCVTGTTCIVPTETGL